MKQEKDFVAYGQIEYCIYLFIYFTAAHKTKPAWIVKDEIEKGSSLNLVGFHS